MCSDRNKNVRYVISSCFSVYKSFCLYFFAAQSLVMTKDDIYGQKRKQILHFSTGIIPTHTELVSDWNRAAGLSGMGYLVKRKLIVFTE